MNYSPNSQEGLEQSKAVLVHILRGVYFCVYARESKIVRFVKEFGVTFFLEKKRTRLAYSGCFSALIDHVVKMQHMQTLTADS